MESLKTIIRSVMVAQKHGSYSLTDAATLYKEIKDIKEELPSKEIIDTLIRAVNVGQKSGAFTLEEASVISEAIVELQK